MVRWLLPLTLALACLLYWPGLHGGFFFDDEANILQIASLQVDALSLGTLFEAWQSGISGPLGRPVAQLSFALNHYFSGGFDPFAFKVTNLVIHLLTGVMVFFVARRLLIAPVLAAIASSIWLLHPIQLTSVLYVVQRMTSLAALFLLAGFLLHMRGRERGGRTGLLMLLAAWMICWPLSFFSKESGILFPLFVLAWELIIRRSQAGYLDRFSRVLGSVLAVGMVGLFIYLWLPAGQWLWAGYQMRDFSPVERLLTEARVLWFYVGLLLFPRLDALGLYHDDIALSTGILSPWTTLSAWLGLIGLIWLAWRVRQKAPVLAFGIGWFLVGHSLESTILPLEIAHEHRNYLPSLGLFIAGTWGLAQVVQKSGWQKTLGTTLVALYAGYSVLITGLRSHQYGDEIRRTQIESQHHPESARTHYEAGRVLVLMLEISTASSPQYFFARKHFEKAGEIDPNFKVSWLGLIHLSCQVKTTVDPGWVDELTHRIQRSALGPGDRNVLFSVKEMAIAGTLCLPRGDVERLFYSAISNRSASAHAKTLMHSWLADYLTLAVRDLPAAQVELDKSLAIAPYNPSNRLKRAQLAFLQGRHEEASAMLDQLHESSLLRSERDTLALLRACLEPGGSPKCSGS